jgi:IS5 family transposase
LNGRFTYTDSTVVEVYLWAVINDRPTEWACCAENWYGVRMPPGLPSPSQMSRRLRTRSVKLLLDRLERWVLRRARRATLACAIDGQALLVASHSGDRQARRGRARRGMGRGYKLHLLIDLQGTIWSWRVAQLNVDEREMARRMARQLPPTAYLLADANYNSNRLFQAVREQGVQLLAPRRQRNPGQGLGHRRHDPARLRSIELLEQSEARFGPELLTLRNRIEGSFGTLTCHAAGMACLPAWVRTYRRVRRWVQAKLIITELRNATV